MAGLARAAGSNGGSDSAQPATKKDAHTTATVMTTPSLGTGPSTILRRGLGLRGRGVPAGRASVFHRRERGRPESGLNHQTILIQFASPHLEPRHVDDSRQLTDPIEKRGHRMVISRHFTSTGISV
jgi:hypothetical protein